ncbi:MAG: hypothetical protein ACT4P2_04850 [Pseudomonadota bacterium]
MLLQGFYQGLLASIVALVLFTRVVGLLGAGHAAWFPALVPGFANALAYPVLGEVPSWLVVAGIVLVSVGMAVAGGAGSARPARRADA